MNIHLNHLFFHSFHGVYEEERITGGDYELNITVSFQPANSIINKLDETINYVSLYEIVKERMAVPTPLLETIAMEIAETFMAQFSMIDEVEISITKHHPPIPAFKGSVGVSYHKKRS